MFPYLIIGSGIAGMTLALRLGVKRCLLIDKNDYLGGRLKWADFHDEVVNLGAGVLRPGDKDVIALCQELGVRLVPYEKEVVTKDPHRKRITQMLQAVIDVFQENKLHVGKMTFEQFLHVFFQPSFVKDFYSLAEFRDFFQADVENTINNYPLQETLINNGTMYYLEGGWKAVVKAFEERLTNIHLGETVQKIYHQTDKNLVITDKGVYEAEKVIICGDITCSYISLVNFPKIDLFDYLGSIPFLRIYTYHPAGVKIPYIKTSTFLNRIIPSGEHILLAAYTDNQQAIHFHDLLLKQECKQDVLDIVNLMLQNVIKDPEYKLTEATDYIYHFWEHGIHYYKPLCGEDKPNTVYPEHGLYFCGEYVSESQGWTQGAVSSANEMAQLIS